MATITTRIPHASGIPLGGLGTGTVEIQPDGCLHEWQIFNTGKWAPRQPDFCEPPGPEMPTDKNVDVSLLATLENPLAWPAADRQLRNRVTRSRDTTLDSALADAWAGQLTTLAKCTWWTKAGDFAVWEGLGCCGFHTTDITYQGSFNILALFPELQKGQMEMGAGFQRDDGRVHHFFTPDLSSVDRGFDRVDMNQQFVLLVCRDYLWTNDKAYLERIWPHVVRAMDNTALLDSDGDGLLNAGSPPTRSRPTA